MADPSHDIGTLNGLIGATIDSVDGYTEAAKDSGNSHFAAMFTSRAQQRRAVATDLQGEVRRLGGNPEDNGSTLAGVHRAFIDLKATVTGHDDKAIVNEIERGEDHIMAKFEQAMGDPNLLPDTRTAIGAAWRSVKAGHDEVSDLKHSMQRS
jgi:uncharacterized protein (TIGR02284 family)